MRATQRKFAAVVVLVWLAIFSCVGAYERYVESWNGTDTGDCLNQEEPCATIEYAFNTAGNGDTILIAGEFVLAQTVAVSKMVNISSWHYDVPAVVACGGSTSTPVLTAFSLLTSSTLHNFHIHSCPQRAVYVYLQNTNQMTGAISRMVLYGNRQGIVLYSSGIAENKVKIEHSVIRDNVAEGAELTNGCGISSSQSALLLSNVTIENNLCNGNGGGIYSIGGQISTEQGVVISGNKANSGGGWFGEMIELHVSEAEIADNTATQYGGGLFLSSCQMELKFSEGRNNVAGVSGGFGYLLYGGWNSTHCSFNANSAEATDGGGLYAYECTLWMVNSSWAQHYAPGNGGAIYLDGSTTMLNLTSFHHNKAETGAGIYALTGSLMMWANEFTFNEATNEGGAIYALTSTPIMWNSTVHSNFAKKGGAFYMAGSSFIVYNTTCIDNHAVGPQGAAVSYQNGSTLVFTNVTFSQNTVYVEEAGGVIGEEQEDIVCVHSSVNIYDLNPEVSEVPIIVCLLQCEAVFIWGEIQDWICQQTLH